jgi:trigger factor
MPGIKELKKAISDQISNEHNNVTRSKMKKSLLDILDKKYSFDLPEGMVSQEYNSVCQTLNKDKKPGDKKNVKDEGRENKVDEKMSKDEKLDAKNIAERRVKLGLLMGEIGRNNNLDISEEEINKAVMAEAQKYPGQEKQVLDYFKKNKEASQNLAGPLFEEKVFDFICEMADVKEKKVSVEELYKEDQAEKKLINKNTTKKIKSKK